MPDKALANFLHFQAAGGDFYWGTRRTGVKKRRRCGKKHNLSGQRPFAAWQSVAQVLKQIRCECIRVPILPGRRTAEGGCPHKKPSPRDSREWLPTKTLQRPVRMARVLSSAAASIWSAMCFCTMSHSDRRIISLMLNLLS